MTAFIRAWATLVVSQRIPIILLTAALVVATLFTGGTIPFDNSTQRYFIPGDPAVLEYDSLYDNFGDNEYLVVGIEATDEQAGVFSAPILQTLSTISDFLEFHPNVTQLRSLTTYQYIHGSDDDLSTDYLIEDIGSLADSPAEIERVKTILVEEDLAIGTLVTEDWQHTRIAARIEYSPDTSAIKVAVTQDLYRFIEEENLESDEYQLHLSGYPLINERFETLSANDTALLIPIMIVVMIGILFFCFRSFVATVLPLFVIAAGILLLQEIQYYIGIPHTTVDSAAIPSTMIIIGIGISVHVLLEFFHCCVNGLNGKEAAQKTVEIIWLPALFTAVTTSAGFLALSATRLLPLREFALLGAIGSLLLFLFALTTLPAMLSFVNKLPARTSAVLASGFISSITRAIPSLTALHRTRILILGAVIIVFAGLALPSVRIDTNYITLFKENSDTRQDIQYFDDTFKGTMTLDIVLDSGEENGIYEPEFTRAIDDIETWLNDRDTLGPINSLADYLKEINLALNGDDPSFYRLPETREMTAQFMLLYDSAGPTEDLSDIIDFEKRLSRLVVPVVNMPASDLQQEMNEITEYMQANYGHLKPVITGTMALLTAQQIYTAEGMLRSFLVALGVITLFFVVLFRSLRYGLLSIVPSVVPIVLAASVAGFLGVFLDQSAVVVFAMTMGLAVDDAIHVMSRYLVNKKAGVSTRVSIERAMNESGRAVLFTSMVLVFGFSVLTFGTFTTVINVGLFGSVIMSLALLGDLVFLPAILYLVDGDEKQDNVMETQVS